MSKARDTVETLRTVLVDGDVTNANFTGADLEIGKGGTGASSAGAARTALGLVVGTDVLAPDGSAANLTNLPAGGAEDFVASGTLPNGKPVILKANGQVEVVGISTSEVIPNGSAATVTSAGDQVSVSAGRVAGQFLVAYRNGGNTYGTASVGTVSGDTISFGTPVVFEAANSVYISCSGDTNTDNKYVIAYADIANSWYGTAVVATVSGTTVSFGTPVVYLSADSGHGDPWVMYDPNAANKVCIVYQANSTVAKAVIGTVSGTSISYGTAVTFNTSTSMGGRRVAFDEDTSGKFVLTLRDNAGLDATVCTYSGTTITVGSTTTIATTSVEHTVAFNAANKCLITYVNTNFNSYLSFKLGTVSGTSISFGSSSVINSVVATEVSLAKDPSTANTFVTVYKDLTSSLNKIKANKITMSGDTPTFGSAHIVGDFVSQSNYQSFFDPSVAGRFVTLYRYSGAVSAVKSDFFAATTNLTSTNFLGTATAAYTNGQTASIMLKGGISDNQTSLTAGSTYYVQPAGTFATSAGTPFVLAGKAVSATSLLLYGLNEIPSQTSQSGKFLTTDGSAASWGEAAGLVLLSTVNASNSATVTIDSLFTSTYSKYLIEVTDLRPLTADVSIQLEREINSSYAQYTYVWEETKDGNWSNRKPNITQPLNNSPSQRGASFTMTIYDPANALTVNTGTIFGVCQSGYAGGTPSLINNWLLNTNPYALTGLRFKASSGNISGVFKIYGVSI